MEYAEFCDLVKEIVLQATQLKDKHIPEHKAVAEWVGFFSQSEEEYEELLKAVKKIGKMIKETPTGLIFLVPPIATVSGSLRVIKVRLPDATKPERGDADFRVSDYRKLKKEVLKRKEFRLIQRSNHEMIELMDKVFNVRAYFSDPPVSVQYKLKK